MKRKFILAFLALLLFSVISSKAFSQQDYWREGFEGGEISTLNPLTNGGPNDYYAASVNSGTGSWFLHNTYRTTGTSCSASGYGPNHLRFLQNAADSPYVVLPVVNYGVAQIHFARSANSGTAGARTRRLAFFIRADTIGNTNPYQGGGWTRIATANPGDLFCSDTTVNVPGGLAATVRRIAIGDSQASNADVDSIWLVSAIPIPAPVNFVSTKAFVIGNGVRVEWNTADESGILNYIIEKSTDGIFFKQAGVVSSTNRIAASYNYFDASPAAGINYYRIKAVEIDGSKLTAIMKVSLGKKALEFIIASNPVKSGSLNVQINGMEKGVYMIILFNNAGQQVFAKSISVEGGSLSQGIQMPRLSGGLYSVQLRSNSMALNKSIVIE